MAVDDGAPAVQPVRPPGDGRAVRGTVALLAVAAVILIGLSVLSGPSLLGGDDGSGGDGRGGPAAGAIGPGGSGTGPDAPGAGLEARLPCCVCRLTRNRASVLSR